MNKLNSRRVSWIVGAVVVVTIAFLCPRSPRPSITDQVLPSTAATDANPAGDSDAGSRRAPFRSTASAPSAPATAEEIVAGKLKRFAQSRRDSMRGMARQKNITVPAAVERFFDAVESGDWN